MKYVGEAITTLIGFIRQVREMERSRRAAFAYYIRGKVQLWDHTAVSGTGRRSEWITFACDD